MAWVPYAIMAVSAIAGGNAANAQARKEAEAQRIQTEQRIEERTDEIVGLLGRQRSAYLGGAGVKLSGSAMSVIEETRQKGAEDIRRLQKTGAAREESLLLGGQAAMWRGVGSAAAAVSGMKGNMGGSPGGPTGSATSATEGSF